MAEVDTFADTHVLGSVSGYGTLVASRGVTDSEHQELESLQFGELSTGEAIARLETQVVMTGRTLRSGRFAISRMLPGGVDDAGRPTVEIVTLILEQTAYDACVGALPHIASDRPFWQRARAEASSGIRISYRKDSPSPPDQTTLPLFDLWRAARASGGVGVLTEADVDTLFRFIATLHPTDRRACRWGVGLLSLSTTADICSVAPGVALRGPRDVIRVAQPGAWHCGLESAYAEYRVESGLATLPSVEEVVTNGRTDNFLRGARGTGGGGNRVRPTAHRHHHARLRPAAIGAAVLSTVVLIVSLMTFKRHPTIVPAAQSWESDAPVEPAPVRSVPAPDSLSRALPTPEPVSPAQQSPAQTPTTIDSQDPSQNPNPVPDTQIGGGSAGGPSSTGEEGAAASGGSAAPRTLEQAQSPGATQNAPAATPATDATPAVAAPPATDATATAPQKSPLETLRELTEEMKRLSPKDAMEAYELRRNAALAAQLESPPPPDWRNLVRNWVDVLARALVLDTKLKKDAASMEEWVKRQAGWWTDGTRQLVADRSGFALPPPKPEQLDQVPLNPSLLLEWRTLLHQFAINAVFREFDTGFKPHDTELLNFIRNEIKGVSPDEFAFLSKSEQSQLRKDVEQVLELRAGFLDRVGSKELRRIEIYIEALDNAN